MERNGIAVTVVAKSDGKPRFWASSRFRGGTALALVRLFQPALRPRVGVPVAARGVVAWCRHRLGLAGPSVVVARRAATSALRPVGARVERDALAPAARRRQLADDSLLNVGHRGDQLAIVSGGRTSECVSVRADGVQVVMYSYSWVRMRRASPM